MYYPKKAILLVLLSLVAAFFMFYRLGEVPPPYPWSDEGSAGQDAVATLREGFSLYYPDQGGGGNLWVYLAALAFWLVGPSILTLRWLVGLIGILSVLFTFGALSELFRRFMPYERARWYAFVAALWMATATWHVTMSRIGWPPALLPLLVSAAFFFMWRGLRTERLVDFLGMGVALGLSAYTYLPGRFMVIVPVTFLLLELGISLARKESPPWWNLRQQLLLALGVGLLVALPMLVLYLSAPETFVGRVLEVTTQNEVDASNIFIRSLGLHANAFGFTLNLDRTPFEGLILGSITTVFFLIGLLATVWRISLPSSRYMLLWWLLLITPSITAPPPAESTDPTMLRRAIGALPVTFAFAVLGLEFIETKLGSWLASTKLSKRSFLTAITTLVAVVAIGTTAWQTKDGFFVKWANSPDATRLFNPINVQLVDWMNENRSNDTAFVFPIRAISRSATRPWIYVVRFMYDGAASYIPDEETSVPSSLLAAIEGKSDVYLLAEERVGADVKEQFSYLLRRLGHLDAEDEVFGFKVQRFRLTRWHLDSPSEVISPNTVFGDDLVLRSAESGVTSQVPNRLVWLELEWENRGSQSDYQVTVRLEDSKGHIVAQQDRLLLNNLYSLPTSNWDTGAVERGFYWLDISPVVLSGEYQLSVGVYDVQTGENLLPQTGNVGVDLAVPLGLVSIHPPTSAEDVIPMVPINAAFKDSGLTLLGLDAPLPEVFNPGQPVTLPVLLRSDESPPSEGQIEANLLSQDNSRWPLKSTSPPSLSIDWPANAPFRIYLDGTVPRDVPSGQYLLELNLVRGDQVSTIKVGNVEVIARDHHFEVPRADYIPNDSAPVGDVARLLGYSLDLSGAASGSVKLTLFWQALNETDVSYKVFAHMLDSAGALVTQVDREPAGGEALTTSWLSGEVIVDEIEIPTTPRLAEVRTIAVGLYNPLSDKRLPVGDDDRILLVIQP